MEESEQYLFGLPQYEVQIQTAEFWKRAAAYLIDCLIFYFVFFQIFMLIYIPAIGAPVSTDMAAMELYLNSDPVMSTKIFTGVIGAGFMFLMYFVLSEKLLGTSFGKQIFNLNVVNNTNKEITYSQSILRNLTKTIVLPFLIFDVFGLIWTFGRQRFSDILAQTRVINSPKLELDYEVFE